jgi:hypothetical protein
MSHVSEASAEESDSMDWTAVEFDEVVEMEWMVHLTRMSTWSLKSR